MKHTLKYKEGDSSVEVGGTTLAEVIVRFIDNYRLVFPNGEHLHRVVTSLTGFRDRIPGSSVTEWYDDEYELNYKLEQAP